MSITLIINFSEPPVTLHLQILHLKTDLLLLPFENSTSLTLLCFSVAFFVSLNLSEFLESSRKDDKRITRAQ